MNVQPIGAVNQTKYRKNNNRQNIAFGTSCLSITKEEFLNLAKKRNEKYPMFREPKDLEEFVMTFWTKIKGIIQKYKDDRIVHVHISNHEGDDTIWAEVERLGFSLPGRKKTELIPENIFSDGESFAKKIDDYAATLK